MGSSEFRAAVHLVGASRAPMTRGKLEMVEIGAYEPLDPISFSKIRQRMSLGTDGRHIANYLTLRPVTRNSRCCIRGASAARLPLAPAFV